MGCLSFFRLEALQVSLNRQDHLEDTAQALICYLKGSIVRYFRSMIYQSSI